jgi:hypothetical protein
MTGQAERTIQENSPIRTDHVEQYKKNKLNLEGVDQKEMEEYRKSLEREGHACAGYE